MKMEKFLAKIALKSTDVRQKAIPGYKKHKIELSKADLKSYSMKGREPRILRFFGNKDDKTDVSGRTRDEDMRKLGTLLKSSNQLEELDIQCDR